MFQTNLPQINYNTPLNNSNNLNSQEAPTPNSNIMKPNVRFESNNNESYVLLFQIPLFNGKYEFIKMHFLKFEKNIYQQYEKLKNKYFKIKNIAFDNSDYNPKANNFDYYNSQKLGKIIAEINNQNNN